jgi:uncharacterized protein DUF3179
MAERGDTVQPGPRRAAWTRVLLVVLPLAMAASIVLPLWLDQPFRVQTARTLTAAYLIRAWSRPVTLAGAAVVLWLAAGRWREWRRPSARLALIAACAVAAASAWFARQNPFEWMFNPLPRTAFVAARDAAFVDPADIVLAVAINGDAAAYPIRQLAYHHVVNDFVGRVPIVVTY